jgi:predicted molibdopterin-dependent oxidoreductase YjgC
MAFNTNNIGNSVAAPVNEALTQCFGKNSSTCSFSDINLSDLIVTFGSDVCTDYPIVSLKVKEAVRNGAKLAIINSEPTRLDPYADMTLKVSKRMSEDLLQTILNYILNYALIDKDFVERRTLGLEVLKESMKPYSMDNWAEAFWIKPAKVIEFIHLYVRAKNPMIIVDADKLQTDELALLSNLALVTGNVARAGAGVIALRAYGNSQGQIEMGVSPGYLPGQEPAFSPAPRQKFKELWGLSLPKTPGIDNEDMMTAIRSGQIRGVLAIAGANDDVEAGLLGDGRTFTVAVAPVMSDAIAQADVILPGTTFAETDGTFISSEQRLQRLHQAIEPVVGRHTWRVLCELSTSLGYPMAYDSAAEIFEEIGKVVHAYGTISFDDIAVGGVTVPSCDEHTTFIAPQWLEKIADSGVREQR